MPGEVKDVKDSSTNGVKDNGSPTVEQLLANAKAENERKQTEIQSLKAEKEKVSTRLEELELVERKYGELTAKQEAEKKRLERGQDTIENQIEQLKLKPEAKPWFAQQERELEKAVKTAEERGSIKALTELAVDLLEDTAEELGETEDFKGITDKELLKKLKPYLTEYDDENPFRRTKLAIRDFKKAVKEKKDHAELTKKNAELNATRETNGRGTRDDNASVDDLIKSGNRASAREKLGIMHRQK